MTGNSEHEPNAHSGLPADGQKDASLIGHAHDECAAHAVRALVVAALDLCDWAGRMELVGILLADALTVLDDEDDETETAVQRS